MVPAGHRNGGAGGGDDVRTPEASVKTKGGSSSNGGCVGYEREGGDSDNGVNGNGGGRWRQ